MNIEENNDQILIPNLEDFISEEDIKEDIIEDIIEEEVEEEVIVEKDETATIFSEMLKERGLLSDKEYNSFDEIEEELENYKTDLPNKVKDNLLNSTPQLAKDLVDYVLSKPDLTEEDLKEFYTLHLQDQTNDLNDNEQARAFLNNYYKDQFPQDSIDILLDSLEDSDKLLEKAKELNTSKSKEILEQAKDQAKVNQELQEQKVKEIQQEFESLTWKKAHKDKVYEQVFSGKTEETLLTIASSPKAIIQLANLVSYYDPKTQSFDLSTFVNQVETKKNDNYRDRIVQSMQNSGNKSTYKTNNIVDDFKPVFNK